MAAIAKEALGFVIRYTGITALIRTTIARRRVGVLVYHDPPPSVLEGHLRYLSAHYSFTTIEDLVTALESRDWSRLPARAVALTFDDGYRQNLELVPLFERYGVRPTIYVTSESVLRTGRFWFREPGVEPEPLKALPNEQRLAAVERLLRSGEHLERDALNPDEISRLDAVADVESHSVSHPILPMCTDAESDYEIRQSRADVAVLTGRPCDHFSFPNGDYSARELALVRRAGYRSARSADIGWNRLGTDPFRLRIIGTPDRASINVLAAQLAGVLLLKNVVRRLRRSFSRRRTTRPA